MKAFPAQFMKAAKGKEGKPATKMKSDGKAPATGKKTAMQYTSKATGKSRIK